MSHNLPKTVSAAVICLNEEQKIAACLKSLSFCDETIVVDSGSTDNTVAIAQELGAKVIHHDWPGHIEQKNYVITQTNGEWVLSVDADERVTKTLRLEIQRAVSSGEETAYWMPRVVYYINRWIRHSGWYPASKIRLFRRDAGAWGGENPHDQYRTDQPVGHLKGDLIHLSFDDIGEHVKTLNRFTDVAAAERIMKGRYASYGDIALRPLVTFIKMYFIKAGCLDGVPGLIAALLSTYHVFCKYVKIAEGTKP
jgi:glycosyltransferase involved in cell wall biosynthesis